MSEDSVPYADVPSPTEPGFYMFDGGNQNMVFLLGHESQWYTIFSNNHMEACDWGYIEQALSVYNLIKIESPKYKPADYDKVRGVLQDYRYGGFSPQNIIDDLKGIGIVFMAER